MIDTLKGEHLSKEKYYIQTCIHTRFLQSLDDLIRNGEISKDLFESAENINRFCYQDNNNCKINFRGDHGYIISDVNEKPKYSTGYFDCLGLIVVGEHKDTGKNISFITHHDPKFLAFPKFAEQFEVDLKSSLQYIKAFCKVGSVDVVLIGGLVAGDFEEFIEKNLAKYKFSIELTSNIVEEVLGFLPSVVGGPSVGEKWKLNRIIHFKSIFFDTQNRRLYLLKGYNDLHFHFIGNQIEKYTQQIRQVLLNRK